MLNTDGSVDNGGNPPLAMQTSVTLRDDDNFRVELYGENCEALLLSGADKPKIPAETIFLLASGSSDKEVDWKRLLKWVDLKLVLANKLMALEESEEEEANSAEIAIRKIEITIESEWGNLTKKEKQAALEVMGQIDAKNIIKVSEDRSVNVDVRLRDHESFQEFKDLPLVKEAFEGDFFPAHRLKELMSVMGGVPAFLKALNKAHEELPEIDPVKYANLSREHETSVAVAFKPFSGSPDMPIPAEGIVINAISKRNRFEFPSDAEFEALLESDEGLDLDLGHLEYPQDSNATFNDTRKDNKNPYFDTNSFLAIARDAFTEIFDVPKLQEARIDRFLEMERPNFTVAGNVGKRAIKKKLPSGAKVDIAENPKDLSWLARSADHSDAVVLMPYSNVGRKLKVLENKNSVLLRFFEVATMKSLYDNHYTGQPLMVSRGLEREVKPVLQAMVERKAMALKSSQIVDWFRGDRKLANVLWNEEDYNPAHGRAEREYDLWSADRLWQETGITNPGFTFSMIGSASMILPSPLVHSAEITEWAAQHRMTQLSGGGTRSNMGAFLDGAAQAYHQGYRDFNVVGIRTPLASRREGSMVPFMQRTGFQLTRGALEDESFTLAGKFHFTNQEFMAPRQHLVEGPAHAIVTTSGGLGTVWETLSGSQHNIGVAQGKPGFFPGCGDAPKDMIMMNSLINGGSERVHDFYHAVYTPEEQKIMRMQWANTVEEATDLLAESSQRHGFEVRKGPRLQVA